MSILNVVAFVTVAGVVLMLVLPAVAALVVKLRRGGRAEAGRAARRAAEVEDVFHPAQRRQLEQMEISAGMRVDAENGEGDPLEEFPDPDDVRDQLDPDGVYEARRGRSARRPR